MAHQRQLIREAVKAQLVGKTSAGARVYETRVVPWARMSLPVLAVYTLKESVDPTSRASAPRELARSAELVVEGVVEAGENVDDALDELALEVERALHADPTFAGTASDSILASTDLEVGEEGGKPVGFFRLTYTVTFYTYAPEAADVPLQDFATADVRHELGGNVHPDNQAHDVVAVPTT